MARPTARHLLLVATLAAQPAHALDAAAVFEKASPSVWALRGLDSQEKPFTFGSAVVIGPGRLVTACHVLARAKAIQLRRENVTYEANLEYPDVERDVCILFASGLGAPAAELAPPAELRIGQRAYVVSHPPRQSATLGEGLVSSLQSEDTKLPPLQLSAPLQPGASGAGVFDDRGRLIGIATLLPGRPRSAQNLHFAIPAQWIGEAPERAKTHLAKLHATAAAVGAGLPPVGRSWRYSYKNSLHARSEQAYTVQVTGIDGWNVKESVKLAGDASADSSTNAKELRFAARKLDGAVVVELAPYLPAVEGGATAVSSGTPTEYPDIYHPDSWRISPPKVSQDMITVRAGSFRTIRVEVSGENPTATAELYGASTYRLHPVPTRFEYVAWYASDVARYVMIRHRTWGIRGQLGDELVELLEYQPK